MTGRSRWRVLAAAGAVLLLAGGRAGADLNNLARGIIDAADLRQTQFGLIAVDLSDNSTLISINPDEPMMPASNMKLVTTTAALRVLGPDFAFRTDLRLIPAQQGPDAHGPILVVHGDGDPGLGDSLLLARHKLDNEQVLQMWVSAVKKAGVTEVDKLIVDDRVFDQAHIPPDKIWPAEQLNRHYCAQVAGINFNDNCLDCYPEPTTPGESPRVIIRPAAPFLSITNRAQTDKTEDQFWVTCRPGTNDLTFFGKVKTPATVPVQVPFDDPPIFFGRLLASRLGAAGVRVRTVERAGAEDRLPEGELLHRITTTIDQIIQRCNKDSENLFAECLLKRMSRADTGQPGSWEQGASAIRKALVPILGPSAAAITIADGSGLSSEDRVTARILMDLVRLTYLDKRYSTTFLDSLSVGGQDGTLRERYIGPEFKGFKGKILGKSGYINPGGNSGVSTLTGLIFLPDATAKDGQRVVAFSFLFNGFKPPNSLHDLHVVQDKIVHLLVQQFAKP